MTLPPIEELLPHRGTMLLLDRVLAFSAQDITAECTPKREGWYADARGNMPAWIGIELMAQAIAAHVGLIKRSEGKPVSPGVLLGTRRYAPARAAFPAAQPLLVASSISFRDESGLAAYDCRIEAAGERLVEATLKVFEPADFQAFLQAAGAA
jgi:predicted hotdog family 3-hydroxylacyl-ACP dehydratase